MKPTETQMYNALLRRDSSFEGIFVVAVKTTGIFCRPTCHARKPKRENVDFFSSTKDALAHGYRPCKVCSPMVPKGDFPDWIRSLLDQVKNDPTLRLTDYEIRKQKMDPNRVRRWFKTNHKMTFQAYLRSIRLGQAFGRLTKGGKVIDAAFDSGYESLSGFTDAFKKLTGTNPSKSLTKNIIHTYQISTPLGPMIAGAVKEGICLLEFTDRRGFETQLKVLQKRFEAKIVTSSNPLIEILKKQLNEYFDGKRKTFDLPIAAPGTEFQKKVWKALQEIPHGETRSYRDQAIAIGNLKAVRAVAKANGDNRIAIVIPCHRVIGSNGDLVGYAGGLERKKFMLDLEKNLKQEKYN
jgi:AraC family transcriptional regulator of adaptative response/methylated-DNA-[protein]-cysteine methyltransferase